jgi:hypothetical protein
MIRYDKARFPLEVRVRSSMIGCGDIGYAEAEHGKTWRGMVR